MAGENIRINELPADAAPNASDVVAIDGTTTRKATLTDAVAAGRPTASQAEAEAGVNALKAMTPLTTKQAMVAQGATLFASAAQGATADSAIQTITGGVSAQVDATDPQNPVINFTGLGTGDMLASNYDPDNIGANAFNQDNMVDGTTNKNFTATLKTKLDGIPSDADKTDATNVAAAGAAMKSNNLSDLTSIPTSAANLGIIRDAVKIYGADGGGTNPNDTAFGNANTAGGLIFIPKPATKYAFTSNFATTAAAWLPDPSISWANLTDSGKFNLYRGHFTGTGNGSNQWRLSDRVFIGEAASKWAGVNVAPGGIFQKDAGTSWFGAAADGPAYLAVGASLVVIAPENSDSGLRTAGCFAAKSSDLSSNALGLAAHVENTRNGTSSAWATYISAWHKDGAAGASNWTYANETEVVDSSGVSIPIATSYGVGVGAMGFWIHCGGHSAYGPDPTRPSVSAITIGRGGTAGLGWVSGLTFINSGIYGTDGSAASSTFGNAISLARMHKISWAEPGTKTEGASVVSMVTAASNRVYQEFRDNNIYFRGVNQTPIFLASYGASSANYIAVLSVAASSAPQVVASGSDTNIDLRLVTKGTGVIRHGTHTAIGSETVTGYITIKDNAGTTRKMAVVS